MHTVRIYRLDHLSPTLLQRLKAAQMEAAQVWNSQDVAFAVSNASATGDLPSFSHVSTSWLVQVK